MNKLTISNKLLKKVKNGLITKDQAMLRRFLRLTKKRGRFDPLAHKLEIVKKIKNFAENGEVLLIESGRDCDGVEYGGRTCLMDANFVSVNAYIEKAEDWADGAIYFEFDRPSNAENYSRSSRDLTLEAYENGHPHVIYI
jgi:hypothetical protein